METWVESIFYSEPAKPQNAPETRQSSGRSRAIDIFLTRNPPAPARISYSENPKLATASRLVDIIKKPLLDSTVYAENAPTSKGKLLTMNSLPHQVSCLWIGSNRFNNDSYENNWTFARSLLCRKYVKDVLPEASGVCYEDPDLMKFEWFLNAAAKRNDLSFISMGLSTCDGKLLASKDRLLYTFGFDWLGVLRNSPSANSSLMDLKYSKVWDCNSKISSNAKKNTELNHRRTVILFNELHSQDDGLPFSAWISPDAPGSDLWDLPADHICPTDDEAMALLFIQRFVARIWQNVVSDLEKVIDECSKHIIYSEQTAFHRLDVNALESVAHNTWRDMMTWHILEKLIVAQRKSVSETRHHMRALILGLALTNAGSEDPLLRIIEALASLEKAVAEDFRSRGQSITDLVYNLINVRNAQAAQRSADAAQQESRDLGRISWITFVFLPLIAVSGIFGMNVDVLISKPPSIRWYFVAVIPFSALVLSVALVSTRVNKHRRTKNLEDKHVLREKQRPL
ncbi:MAG: hypothetical protein Q9175_000599 [Cornicularia normoerica]